MSADKPKNSRFAGQLASLAGRPQVEEKVVDDSQAPTTRETVPVDDGLETFSSHMTRGRKRRLKFAATLEGRKIYEIVGELVEEYLNKHHPELK